MSGHKKKILVHCCCASCSSYVLEYLKERFLPVAYFYNPNIHPYSEYLLRLNEMRKLSSNLNIPLIEEIYEIEKWWNRIEPYQKLPEGSLRCKECYKLRLEATAELSLDLQIPIFTTTLSVSPHKKYTWIAEVGNELARKRGLEFLGEDFKKKDGFKKSVALSKVHGLTRQNYCGCILSLSESFKRKKK